ELRNPQLMALGTLPGAGVARGQLRFLYLRRIGGRWCCLALNRTRADGEHQHQGYAAEPVQVSHACTFGGRGARPPRGSKDYGVDEPGFLANPRTYLATAAISSGVILLLNDCMS